MEPTPDLFSAWRLRKRSTDNHLPAACRDEFVTTIAAKWLLRYFISKATRITRAPAQSLRGTLGKYFSEPREGERRNVKLTVRVEFDRRSRDKGLERIRNTPCTRYMKASNTPESPDFRQTDEPGQVRASQNATISHSLTRNKRKIRVLSRRV